ncbi:TPA: adenylate cyclase, partial [Haemophilus influenzae]
MLQEIELKLAISPQISIELPQDLEKFTILEH